MGTLVWELKKVRNIRIDPWECIGSTISCPKECSRISGKDLKECIGVSSIDP